MTSSVRTAPLLARHALADVGASALVAVLVLVVTFAVAVAPRALSLSTTAELRHDVDNVAVPLRDISSEGPVMYTSGDGDDTFRLMDRALDAVAHGLPKPLSALVGAHDEFGRVRDAAAANSDVTAKNTSNFSVRLAADARIASRITMVSGRFPAAAATGAEVVDVLLSATSARDANWSVGEVRPLQTGGRVRLSGTFEPRDASAPYWKHATSVLIPEIHPNPTSKQLIVTTAYVAPGSVVSRDVQLGNFVLNAWYRLDTGEIDSSNAEAVLPQLRKFLGTIHSVPGQFGNDQPLTLASSTLDALETAVDRTTVTTAVISMAASGPLGVVLAVFTLGSLSVVDRRRTALSLAWSRGGSGWQVRGAMALEGLLLGVVPGVVAVVLAVLLVPSPLSASALLPAALLALVPAAFFAIAASPRGLRPTRGDLDSRARGRVRLVVEALVVLLAVVALVLLFRRGIASNGLFDPLLAATPLLLALAVTVIVLRVYPAPLYAVFRMLSRRRGIVGFLGAARGVRDPAAGVSAVLAVVVAVAVSVFSVTLLSTLESGQVASARAVVGGGDVVTQTSLYFSSAQLAQLAKVPGVSAVAAVEDIPQVAISDVQNVDLLSADTTSLGRIRGDLPSLGAKVAGDIPVVVSDDFDPALRVGDHLSVQGTPAVVAGVLPAASGLGADFEWVLMDARFVHSFDRDPFAPQLAVLSVPGDPKPVTDAIHRIEPIAAFSTYRASLSRTRESPAAAGLGVALQTGVLAGALLAAIALVLTSVISGRSRDRTIGALRTLGLTRAQSTQLVLWELVPIVITALVAGTLLGLALPFTVIAAVDLSAFTGGAAVTAPVFSVLPILAVIGVVLLATALASVVAVLVALRRTPATTVKIGAD